MEKKIFEGKEITIREFSAQDAREIKKFLKFINSLIKEEAKILLNKKVFLKEEKRHLAGWIEFVKKRKKVVLLAEHNNRIVGNAKVELRRGRESHVGEFGISIISGYRGIGLGKYLTKKVISLAKIRLKPRPKVFRLSVCSNNKPAISLYKKIGFKAVARVPKQIQWRERLIDEIIMIKSNT